MTGAESGTNEHGSHTIKVGDRCGTPRRYRERIPDRLDRIVDAVATRDRHLYVARPQALGRAGSETRSAGHRGRPADDADGMVPLVHRGGRYGQPVSHVGPFDEVNRRVARVEADVGDHHFAGQFPPWFEKKTGLQRRKSDRAIGSGRRTQARPSETVDPGRDVDGEDGDTLGNSREVVGAAEARAVGSIDDEIDLDRQRGDVGIEHHASHATTLEPGGGGAAVGPVVALAGDDRHAPSIRPAQKVDGGASHRCAGTFDERSDRHGRGSVDRRHLGGGDDRDHSGSAATTACASVSVWVRLISNRPAPLLRANTAASPCSTSSG